MADKDLDSGFSATTAIEDTDVIPVYKASSDSLWRYMTGASLKGSGLATLSVPGTVTGGAFSSQSSALAINDDAADSIAFDGDANGVAVISGQGRGPGVAIVYFRAGSSPLCSILASDIASGSVVATTGALTGTTGTDGNLTISAHTDDSLYIENRTGSNGTYKVTFISMQDSGVSSL